MEAAGRRIVVAELIPLSTAKLKPIDVTEGPEPLFQRFMAVQETMLRLRRQQTPDTADHPAHRDYARIVVRGEVVARIDNNGAVISSNRVGGAIQGRIPGEVGGKAGPVLAQARAEAIAKLFRGRVETADTAMTQAQWEATPKPAATVDQASMMQDPLYHRMQEMRRARTLFLAQQMA